MTATPEQVVLEYMRCWNAGDFDSLTDLFADDMVWQIMGHSPQSGEYSREVISGLLKMLPKLDTVEPFLLHLKNITANDERAAAEFSSTLTFRDGRQYLNDYHFLFFVENGKIKRGHEYLCTWTAVNHGVGEDIARLLIPTTAS